MRESFCLNYSRLVVFAIKFALKTFSVFQFLSGKFSFTYCRSFDCWSNFAYVFVYQFDLLRFKPRKIIEGSFSVIFELEYNFFGRIFV